MGAAFLNRKRFFRARVLILGLALLSAALLCSSVEIVLVPTASMETTVLVGDHILINCLFDGPTLPFIHLRLPRIRRVRRGDLVSFRSPQHTAAVFLKRVVAVGGDTVEIRAGRVYVNGVPEQEMVCGVSHCWTIMSPRSVPQGHLFVMGDNRDHSEDSRDWGAIPAESVIGEPVLVLWSYAASSNDWLDSCGDVRLSFYWTAAQHLLTGTRWSRTATRL